VKAVLRVEQWVARWEEKTTAHLAVDWVRLSAVMWDISKAGMKACLSVACSAVSLAACLGVDWEMMLVDQMATRQAVHSVEKWADNWGNNLDIVTVVHWASKTVVCWVLKTVDSWVGHLADSTASNKAGYSDDHWAVDWVHCSAVLKAEWKDAHRAVLSVVRTAEVRVACSDDCWAGRWARKAGQWVTQWVESVVSWAPH
jgi:hypothetical protein